MENIKGKTARQIDAAALTSYLDGYQDILIDIGTGDGRFARAAALAAATTCAIGVDACRENLRECSRSSPPNALFIIASAQALPRELHHLATHVTVNFPWGSLLAGLLDGDPALLDSLTAVARPGALIEVRLNASALAEAGWGLEAGAARVARTLREAGISVQAPQALGRAELQALPSTWAKRMAFGRKPHALYLRGYRRGT